jgi:sulfonate transport system permease protein
MEPAGMITARARSRVDPRSVALPLVCAVAWALASASGRWNPHLLVPPQQLAAAFAESAKNADFWLAVGSSLLRLIAGWAIGSMAGVLVGVIAGCSFVAERFIAPSLNSVRQVALFAWIPLLTAWFGSGDVAEVILIALAAFFPAALNTEIGCGEVPATLLEVGRVFEFSYWETVRRIVLPSARPSIAAGLQIALTSAWIGTIGAEYLIDQGAGLGVFLASARIDNRMDVVLVCIIALGLVGYLLSALLRWSFATGSAPRGVVLADD